MTGYYIAGAWLLLCSVVILAFAAASNLQRRNARFDAELARMRTPEMGEVWFDSGDGFYTDAVGTPVDFIHVGVVDVDEWRGHRP